jgi:serine/threonine-protein phosphatase 4 catalytic subunit
MSLLEVDEAIEKLRQCKLITEKEVKDLCLRAQEALKVEDNVVKVDSPVTVRIER